MTETRGKRSRTSRVPPRPLARLAALLLGTSLTLPGALAAPLRLCDDIKPPSSLNPLQVFEWKPDVLLSHLFDGLLGFSPSGQLLPRLARSWDWIDPQRLRLRIRSDVRFHNGEPFDAEVVRWNFARLREMDPPSPRLFPYLHVRATEVVDSHTVDLVTDFHDETLLHRLAAWSWMIPPKAAEELGMDALGRNPIGTGPYRFREWSESGELVLDANPDYWGAPATFPDGLRWSFLPHSDQVRLLLAGELDLVGDVEPIFHRKIQESGVAQVVKGDSMVSVNLVFNCLGGRATDSRIRQAAAHGLNQEDLIRYVARGNGRPVRGTSFPDQVGHLPTSPEAGIFDPTRARELVREATNGGRIRLHGALDPAFATLGRAITIQLAKVGIDVEFEVIDRITHWERFAGAKLAGRIPQDDLFVFACPNPTYHYFFINSLTNHSKGPFSMWSDLGYDTAYEALLRTPSSPALDQLVRKLDRIIERERPMLFLYQVKKGYGVGGAIDFHPTRSGMIDLRGSRPAPPIPEEDHALPAP